MSDGWQHILVPMTDELADVERCHVLNVLAACGGNKSEAARRLGIFRSSLQRKLRKYARGEALRRMEGRS